MSILAGLRNLPIVVVLGLRVVSALIKQSKKLPGELKKSLTWDRGKQLMDHRRFSLATDIDVYCFDPRSPWQRGSNEKTNGLLGQTSPREPTCRYTRRRN